MRKVFLYMTMTLDGFVAGPNNELDWMSRTPDPEMNKDSVDLFKGIDAGFMGYPTASGMIPYWSSVVKNPSASKEELEIARAVNRLHSIIISNKEEKLEWDNAELLLVKKDNDLVHAVTRFKQQSGRDFGAWWRSYSPNVCATRLV